jgi:hypothetical protein
VEDLDYANHLEKNLAQRTSLLTKAKQQGYYKLEKEGLMTT